ncbi:hypothetical protein AN958_11170 [Leucoagaricus sp. SymC.cos]|nr:hypothetical protein AN958_11170 [Leucoagaricus sp. SymC.cos]
MTKKYKPVVLKVRPVLGELPDKFRIVRNITGDPLENLPQLPVHPPAPQPKGRYTHERMEKMDKIHGGDFLWPEEWKLVHWIKPSNSSYHSRWFCVLKKDGKSLRLVHSLEPLNRVMIVHSGLLPATEELTMHFAGRACNDILDLRFVWEHLNTVNRILARNKICWRDLLWTENYYNCRSNHNCRV